MSRTDLQALADSTGEAFLSWERRRQRMTNQQWETEHRTLAAMVDRLTEALREAGLTLENVGWTVAGAGCRWVRLEREELVLAA